jgi:hypothetical protein
MIRFWFTLLILLFSVTATAISFGNTPVEHVGHDKGDIVHCLIENNKRQFCHIGWGPSFKKLKQAKITAPDAYATDLTVPSLTPTPFGVLSSEYVLNRLNHELWDNWRITPELIFMMEWSENPACWKNGVLNKQIRIVSGDNEIGAVRPGFRNYHFPLTNPLNVKSWENISTSDRKQDRVVWESDGENRSIHTEFDFIDDSNKTESGFSPQVLPLECKINLSNVQTVIERETADKILEIIMNKVDALADSMTTETLYYIATMQGAEGVQCLIASQFAGLKQAEKLPANSSLRDLSEHSQANLVQALEMTAATTQYDVRSDALVFLETHLSDWQKSCYGSDPLSLDHVSDFSGFPPEMKNLAQKYQRQRTELQSLVEDAWSLAVLLKLVNEENRKLQWLIDSTIKFRLTTEGPL